ncbi:MAG: hypothetical protein KatS3mg131_3810 [Candidatus Tectimicrobiota bacterium]|nr:MAG: hypothetical protein KatS3mg131_3810 [Candidatus Tectomicrobia bacterium]
MATPIGHALAGYAVYRLTTKPAEQGGRAWLWLCMLLAVAPDFDFLPGLLIGQPARYHQGISHSLGVAGGVSLAVALLLHRGHAAWIGAWGRFLLAYGSHLLIDVFCPDGRPPYGIPLLWPLMSAHVLAPWPVFLGVNHAATTTASTGAWLAALAHPVNLGAIGLEIAVLGSLLAGLLWLKQRWMGRYPRRPHPWRPAAARHDGCRSPLRG